MKWQTAFLILFCITSLETYSQIPEIERYHPYEIIFQGSHYLITDNPVRDIELTTLWRHESSSASHLIHGFFDGNGNGQAEGNIFKVRFAPTQPGKWILEQTNSNDPKLQNQLEGHTISCIPSKHPGFWMVDLQSAGKRWYQRSDGTHPYITGNTMYTFLSEYGKEGPNGSNIARDIKENASYFKKLRFALTGDLFPHPSDKPFLNSDGNPTDDGNYSHRPNPGWFSQRVDLAVKSSFEADLIADLILNGPDSPTGRANLFAAENGNDPTPFLRYIAARYSSFPNVWICLSNEYDIRTPRYTAKQMNRIGHKIKPFLPYPTPLSVHGNQRDWDAQLNTMVPWNDHVIFQNKLKRLWMAADITEKNYLLGGLNKPVINDELAYQGAGDGWNETEVLVAFLGTFLGGGYGSSGHKTGHKLGGYFAGNFDLAGHSASDNLHWFRSVIDENITFWKMKPFATMFSRPGSIHLHFFRNVNYFHRLLANPGEEYVLGGSGAHQNIHGKLPPGEWEITLYDLIKQEKKILMESAQGAFSFDFPDSKAAFIHLKKKL